MTQDGESTKEGLIQENDKQARFDIEPIVALAAPDGSTTAQMSLTTRESFSQTRQISLPAL